MLVARHGAVGSQTAGNIGSSDPDFANVSILLHMDGTANSTTFTDSSSNAFAVTANGNAKVSTTSPKFGTGALLLDGTGDFLSAANNAAFQFGSGNFTIEAFVRFASVDTSNGDVIASRWAGATSSDSWIFYRTSTGLLRFDFRASDGSTYVAPTGPLFPVALNQWYYVAVSRIGNTFTYSIDGITSTATNSAAINNGTANLLIGSLGGFSGREINGQIDEFRITKGVARNISVVPTFPFPDA